MAFIAESNIQSSITDMAEPNTEPPAAATIFAEEPRFARPPRWKHRGVQRCPPAEAAVANAAAIAALQGQMEQLRAGLATGGDNQPGINLTRAAGT